MSPTPAAKPSRKQQGVSQSAYWHMPRPRLPSADAKQLAHGALRRGIRSLVVSGLFVVMAAAALAAVVPEMSRITLFAEFSLLATVLPLAIVLAVGYGEMQRRPALDPCAGPLWMPEPFWIAVSALRDRAFRLHGWIAAVSIAACAFTATARALEPALVATRAENLAPWLAATLALFAGVVVAITNEALARRLRTAFRSGVTDYAATLMARFHGATGLLTLLIAALFFQGDADFLTRLAVATIAVPPLSWAATLGFCVVMLLWPLRTMHRGTVWVFVDTDARAFRSETSHVGGATWSGGPVVVVCSPPDGTRGEHRLACALAGETNALRIESRADIDAWLRSQPEPAHWTASPRRLMFVEPALLDTVRERCVRKGDSVALLTADGALARRWLHDDGLRRNEVPVYAGDDPDRFAAYIDDVYVRWFATRPTSSSPPAIATQRSPRPLLLAQLFERFASFALYAHLLASVTGTTPQPGYSAETVFLIPLLYVVGLLTAGLWLGVGPDSLGSTGDAVEGRRDHALLGSVGGLFLGAVGIAALLTRWSPVFDAALVIAVIGIALCHYSTTNLLVVAYDDPHDAPRRGPGFAALHVIGAAGAALGSAVGFKLPIDSPVPIAEITGLALGVSALYLMLAASREPLSRLNLMRAVRREPLHRLLLPSYLNPLMPRNLVLAASTGLLLLSGETTISILALFLLLHTGAGTLAANDDPRYDARQDKRYQPIMVLVLLIQFGYWVCTAQIDYGIADLLQDAAAETSTPDSSWKAWQPGILLAALPLLASLRGQVLVKYSIFFLGAGLALTLLAALVISVFDFAAPWSPSIGIALATTGQLLVAAAGFTLLHDLGYSRQRGYAIALWLAAPIIAAYVAPAFQSGRPAIGAAVALIVILIFWLAAVFTLTTARNSEISDLTYPPAPPTGSSNTEWR